MPFDGSGTFVQTNGQYSGANVWVQDKNAGLNIIASRHDIHDQDMATGLSTCVTKNGQTTPTANLPLGGFKITGLGTGTARTDAANLGVVQDSTILYGGSSSGAANIFAFTLVPAITSYTTGQRFLFVAHQANTGACTVNVNAVGSVTLKNSAASNDLVAGTIHSGDLVEIFYDGATFRLSNVSLLTAASYTPTIVGSGSMVVGGLTNLIAEFNRISDLVFFSIAYSFTTTGSAAPIITLNLPSSMSGANCLSANGFVTDGGTIKAITIVSGSSTTVDVRLYNGANYTLGAGTIQVSGWYRTVT